MILLAYFTRGVALGFTAGSLPGAPQAYLIGVTLRYGWRLGIVTALTPFIADIPIIFVTVFLLSQFPAWALDMLRVGGGLFMLTIAWNTLRAYRAGTTTLAASEAPHARQVVARMLPIIWLSPGPWLFWATVNGPTVVQAWQLSPLHALAFVGGFYLLLTGMSVLVVLVFDRLRRIDPRLTRALILLSIALLVVFGLSVIAQGIGGLFG